MCKKLAIVALLVGAGIFVVKHYDIKFCRKGQTAEDQIKDLRERLAKLTDGKKQIIHRLAVCDVDLKHHDAEIKALEAVQADKKKAILLRRDELKAQAALVKAGDKPDEGFLQSEEELARMVEAYRSRQANLKARKATRVACQKTRHSLQAELDAYQSAINELEVKVAKLETMLAEARAREVRSRVRLDTGEFAAAKKRTAEIEKRLEVRLRELELQEQNLDEPSPVAAKNPPVDVYKQIDELFGAPQK